MMRRYKKIFTQRLMLVVAACIALPASQAWAGKPSTDPDAQFVRVANTFIEQYLKTHPEAATALGDHRFDARVTDQSARGLAADQHLYHRTLDALAALPAQSLSRDNAVDKAILENQLHLNLFDLETLRVPERETLYYNPVQGVYLLLARDYAPLKQRLESVRARLLGVPAITAAAKQNLTNPPRVFTETAILQNKGAISLVQDELENYLKQAPEMRNRLASARKVAAAALKSYGNWLEHDLLPRSTKDFRIGADNFRQRLHLALDSDLTPEQILAAAQSELEKTQQDMLQTALPLYRSYFPNESVERVDKKQIVRAVLTQLTSAHSDNDTIVPNAQKKLADATEFVRGHALLTLPTTPIKVIVMPEFQRGVAIAGCDAAGPLEKNGETFYTISPTPADWSADRSASFYREYNDAMLNDLTVHEAMPGHYVQLSIANTIKSTTHIRDLFNSGTFVEGWATYAEQFMADAGFGGPETKMEQLKMRLRMIINAILDQKIHAGQMSESDALALMMNDGYQEEGEAVAKWRRAILTYTQLSTYFVGNVELNALGRDLQLRTNGSPQQVHDAILAHGSIATKYIRQLSGM